jgi:hypothetical protein
MCLGEARPAIQSPAASRQANDAEARLPTDHDTMTFPLRVSVAESTPAPGGVAQPSPARHRGATRAGYGDARMERIAKVAT